MKQDFYVPMNSVFIAKETGWTFTSINLTNEEISLRGIVLWCLDNVESKWTMLGGNKFGFEHAGDAFNFKIKFGC